MQLWQTQIHLLLESIGGPNKLSEIYFILSRSACIVIYVI